MKKIPLSLFTFCRVELSAQIGASCLRWCFGKRAADRHAFIPILQELFFGRLNSLKSICRGSLVIVKYNVLGRLNK